MKAEKALIKILHSLERLETKLDKVGEHLDIDFGMEQPSTIDPPQPNKRPSLTHAELAEREAQKAAKTAPAPEPVKVEEEDQSDDGEVEKLPAITNDK